MEQSAIRNAYQQCVRSDVTSKNSILLSAKITIRKNEIYGFIADNVIYYYIINDVSGQLLQTVTAH